MISRQRRACIEGSAFPTVRPSGPRGAVPETVTMLPTRTAREIPTFGSYGLPLDTSFRMTAGSVQLTRPRHLVVQLREPRPHGLHRQETQWRTDDRPRE